MGGPALTLLRSQVKDQDVAELFHHSSISLVDLDALVGIIAFLRMHLSDIYSTTIRSGLSRNISFKLRVHSGPACEARMPKTQQRQSTHGNSKAGKLVPTAVIAPSQPGSTTHSNLATKTASVSRASNRVYCSPRHARRPP